MPTPMHVYGEIAARYGVDPSSGPAVTRFFTNTINTLPIPIQQEIAEEFLHRDAEEPESQRSRQDIALVQTDKTPIQLTVTSHLTSREQDVLEWVAKGKSNHEIAAILEVSENTVKLHLKNILGKIQHPWSGVLADAQKLFSQLMERV
jgi:DNA-binding CsgD family transcriptional regulator